MIEISKEHDKPIYLMARSLLDNASGRKVKLIIKDCEGAKHTIYGKEIIHEDGGNVYTALLFGFEAASYDAIFVYHPDELLRVKRDKKYMPTYELMNARAYEVALWERCF